MRGTGTRSPAEQVAPGAPAPVGTIPLCVPELRGNEWAYVKQCLDTNWVSSVGSFVDRFEQAVADEVGTKFAVATVSGTAAIHVALLLAGVQPDDEVVVSTLTFIAPANAIRYAAAWPVLADADPDYWQMDTAQVADFLEHGCERRGDALVNRATGRRVRALLPVHALGHPAPVEELVELAGRFGLVVVEDAAEGLGARLRTRGGSWSAIGRFGRVGCLSFNGNKLITSGGGGMIVTDDAALAARARYLTTQAKDDPIAYVHHEIGFNYRLGNVQAALGCAQLEHLEEYVAAKRRVAERYATALGDLDGVSPMSEAEWATATFWMYTILVDPAHARLGRDELIVRLAAGGIQSRPLWEPMHRSKAHAGAFALGCDTADRLARQGLSLPCSVGLSAQDQDRVVAALRSALA
jgi:perosamine synthetase